MWLLPVPFPGALRHRTRVDVGYISPLIGDGKMLTAEPMLQAAMTVALLSVCVDSWFILGAIIAHAHAGVQPHPARV